MLNKPDYITARDLLLRTVRPVQTERIPLWEAAGRVLAEDVFAAENVPSFDKSPYDGYALRSADTREASADAPVTLRIVEEVAAGAVPAGVCTEGTAVKILTGAPIPPGADAVVMFEKTRFTAEAVTLFAPARPGENVIRVGEDVRKGELLAASGAVIDPGTLGTLAAQGIAQPEVFRVPRVGILSTGNELVEPGEPCGEGKIYNANRFTLMGALRQAGCQPVYLGLAGDSTEAISEAIDRGLNLCDAVLSTGGVSVGDYDLTPDAMERAGVHVLLRGIRMKPGMACAYGEREGKLFCGLSGNPASSLMNFYAVALPALRKLCGRRDVLPRELELQLRHGFAKKSPSTRLLRGRLEFAEGRVYLNVPGDQGNIVLSSAMGCDAAAVIPAGSGPIAEGTMLKGFLLW